MRKSLWLLIAFGLLITACSKDDDTKGDHKKDDNTVDTVDTKVWLPKVIKEGSDSTIFEYDKDYRLIKKTYADVYDIGHTNVNITAYTYTGDSTSVTDADSKDLFGASYLLQKDKNRVLVVHFSDEKKYYDTIYLDTKQRILRMEGYVFKKLTYTYDNVGNIATITSYDGVRVCTYDTKKNSFCNIALPNWFLNSAEIYGNSNNLVNLTSYQLDGKKAYEQAYVYKYNDSGYPIEIKTTTTSFKNDVVAETSTFNTTISYY